MKNLQHARIIKADGRPERWAPLWMTLVLGGALVSSGLAAPAAQPKKAAEAKGAVADTAKNSRPDRQGYVLRRPGEITFTTGAVIEGKVEKPQVMIILPKERAQADSILFDQSFRAQMLQPLPIDPRQEFGLAR